MRPNQADGMPRTIAGYLSGGIIPAILLGVYNALQKISSQYKISPGMYLIVAGSCVVSVGLLYWIIFHEATLTPAAGFFAALSGIVWGIATCLVAIAYSRFKMPVSKLVPLFNTNTLVAVVLGLLIFSEWKTINCPKLLIGTLLVVVGGILVTNA